MKQNNATELLGYVFFSLYSPWQLPQNDQRIPDFFSNESFGIASGSKPMAQFWVRSQGPRIATRPLNWNRCSIDSTSRIVSRKFYIGQFIRKSWGNHRIKELFGHAWSSMKRKNQQLRRVILLNLGQIAFRFHCGRTRKPIMCMIFGFWDVSMTPESHVIYLCKHTTPFSK